MRKGIATATIFVTLILSGFAQSDANQPEPVSALDHVDSFPRPAFLEGVGRSTLKITTGSPEAQRYFNQGLSLLHCFWDFEALRAFREVVRLDPEAAMGYWGIYMALAFDRSINQAEMRANLARARQLMGGVTEQERLYIQALALRDEGGREGYIREMETLVNRFPEDVEAKLFLARGVMSGYEANGSPREGQLYAQALLRDLLTTHPDHHGVHHYWIHAMEASPRPEEALPSAAKLTSLAPASGHIAHMPGHIYFQIGDYERARQSFLHSMKVGMAYMERFGIDPVDNWNYFHNLDYLVANCAEDGRFEEGLKWARKLQELQLKDPTSSHGSHFISRRGHVRMIRGRFALPEFYIRFGLWDEAAEALEQIVASGSLRNESASRFAARWALFARGMGAVKSEDAEAAGRFANALDADLWQLSLDPAERKREIRPDASLELLTVSSLELRGSLASLQGDHGRAVTLLNQAVSRREELGEGEPPRYARPIHESLAQAHLRAGQYAKARAAYRTVLENRPKSGHAYWGLAQVSLKEGHEAAAATAFEKFLEAWRHADESLPRVQAAKAWLLANGTEK